MYFRILLYACFLWLSHRMHLHKCISTCTKQTCPATPFLHAQVTPELTLGPARPAEAPIGSVSRKSCLLPGESRKHRLTRRYGLSVCVPSSKSVDTDALSASWLETGPVRKHLKLNEVTMGRPQFHSISVLVRRDVTELSPPPQHRGHPNTVNPHGEASVSAGEESTASPTRAGRPWPWTSPASRTARNLLLNPCKLCHRAAACLAERCTRAERSRGWVWAGSSGRSSCTRRSRTPLGQLCGGLAQPPKRLCDQDPPLPNSFPPTIHRAPSASSLLL